MEKEPMPNYGSQKVDRGMKEEERVDVNSAGETEDGQHEAFHIRHSASRYDTYVKQKVRGDKGFDALDQTFPDLSDKGIELAKKEAEKFFDGLNPEKDILFFASSNEARTFGTANIYREEAKKRGFEIITPDKTNAPRFTDSDGENKSFDERTEGQIRMSSMLSLNPRDYREHAVFVAGLPEEIQKINADKYENEEERVNWLRARAIINEDRKGVASQGFGAVYNAYADEVKEYLPKVKNAEQMERRFQNILRLAEWGINKAKEAGLEKNLKILGFGHENYPMSTLKKYFEDGNMANCEALKIEVPEDGKYKITMRGELKEVEM